MKNAKQKAIEKAYGEYWDKVKDFVDENGWLNKDIFYNTEIKYEDISDIGFTHDSNLMCIPTSIKEIKNNFNWISINSEEDLPKEKTMFEFIPCNKFDEKFIGWIDLSFREVFFIDFRRYKIIKSEKYLSETNAWLTNQITHYREIKNSDDKNPIY